MYCRWHSCHLKRKKTRMNITGCRRTDQLTHGLINCNIYLKCPQLFFKYMFRCGHDELSTKVFILTNEHVHGETTLDIRKQPRVTK